LSKKEKTLREAVVIAEDFETPFSIGELADHLHIVEELSHDFSDVDGLFLLNLSAGKALTLARAWLSSARTDVQYWVTYENWARLRELSSEVNELAISKVVYDEDWIKLTISEAEESHLDIESFIVGIGSLNHGLDQTKIPAGESRLSEPTIKSLLIGRLIPIMKPLKRFFPHRVVIYLYKILEMLR